MYGDEEKKTGGYAGYGGYLSRTTFSNKNTPSERATKIIKNPGEDILLFGQKNIARYISAQQQNNEIDKNPIKKVTEIHFKTMAKVTFMDGIATISGRIGDVVFRKSPSGKTYAYQMRKKPKRIPSEKEKKQRQRFSIITKMVSAIMADPTQRAAYEQLQKDTYGAKKMTLRKFVFQKVAATLIPVKATESPQKS